MSRKKKRDPNAPELTVREAGLLGGAKRKETLGAAGFSELGKKGGNTTKERYGSDYYARIGRMGGEVVRDERGPGYFPEIGQKGGERAAELIRKGREAEGDTS